MTDSQPEARTDASGSDCCPTVPKSQQGAAVRSQPVSHWSLPATVPVSESLRNSPSDEMAAAGHSAGCGYSDLCSMVIVGSRK